MSYGVPILFVGLNESRVFFEIVHYSSSPSPESSYPLRAPDANPAAIWSLYSEGSHCIADKFKGSSYTLGPLGASPEHCKHKNPHSGRFGLFGVSDSTVHLTNSVLSVL